MTRVIDDDRCNGAVESPQDHIDRANLTHHRPSRCRRRRRQLTARNEVTFSISSDLSEIAVAPFYLPLSIIIPSGCGSTVHFAVILQQVSPLE